MRQAAQLTCFFCAEHAAVQLRKSVRQRFPGQDLRERPVVPVLSPGAVQVCRGVRERGEGVPRLGAYTAEPFLKLHRRVKAHGLLESFERLDIDKTRVGETFEQLLPQRLKALLILRRAGVEDFRAA